MTKVAGLASNRGRNLRHIDDRRPGGAELAVVLSNHEGAPILDAATERGVPTEVVAREEGESRESHERRILDALSSYDFDLVCLDGYMRILTETFLDATPTTLNVHPSLLPAFPGDDAHEQVLDAGVSVTGCTVHLVTEEVDAGPIVTQESVPVYADDDADSLKSRVLHDAEFTAYPRAVRWFAENRLHVDERGTERAYRKLADTDLDVHVYGVGDADTLESRDLTVHNEDVPEIRCGWFVVFVPPPESEAVGAVLVAITEDDVEWDGVWMIDTARARRVATYLGAEYGQN